MTLHRPDNLKGLAINIALGVVLIASLTAIVWRRVTAGRLDDLIAEADQARSAGDVAAFERSRESARLLLELSQDQQPWLYAPYFGIAIVLIVALSRRMARKRALAAGVHTA